MSYTTFDIETTITTSYKRKASPFDKRNWVVTVGYKKHGAKVTETRFGAGPVASGWLLPILADAKLLFGFNIKFDLLHALQDAANLEAWMKWVADGGQVWDCQLAEYLLEGMTQKNHMLSLDEVAPRYGGNTKVDEVKALWNAGVNTHEIEPELLTRYLCGGPDENGVLQLGDVENTEMIALAQIARARSCGQLNSILLNMGALLFTVEAERNGMYINKARGMELAAELELEVAKATKALTEYLPDNLPFDFNWGSRHHRSALIFGGHIKYDARQYDLKDGTTTFDPPQDCNRRYAYAQRDIEGWLLTNGDVVFLDPFEVSVYEYAQFKGGKNAGEFKRKKVKVDDYTKPKSRMAQRPSRLPGYIKGEKRWETSEPGIYSTGADVVEELGNYDVPFLKLYASLMKMSKDLGTYYYRKDDEGKETGMLTLVNEHGLIHHMLNMCSTVTARLSSSNPNLQNIPKGNKSDVKTVFVSRFGEDGKIIQSDFSSLEVYVQAILTKCQQLIDDLRAGLDMHCVKLAAKEGMTYEDVYALAKGDKYDKEWDYKRTKAKEYSFQSAFGAGDKAIAAKTGMAIEEVARLRAADEARYPEIPAYYASITQDIKLSRRPSRVIQHPEFPGVQCHIGEGSFRTPDGKLYCYTESPSPEYLVKKGITASFSPTEIRNYVVQGSGGEWAKAAMYLSVRAFYQRSNFGGLALLVNQVHDAVYADSSNEVALQAAALLHACMEGASDYMEWKFGWSIPVPVPSDTSWGASMMDEDKIPGLKELAAPLRLELRKQYMVGYTPSLIKQGNTNGN